ncbi:MAG: ribonuclease HI [Oligoflexia bacterium]|nr:ribonuclease HI [Oligoflexia bacterium]
MPRAKKRAEQFLLPAEFLRGNGQLALFTDGACRGNPGVGAWAFLLQKKDGTIAAEKSAAVEFTTNNKMELTAVIKGLEFLAGHTEECEVEMEDLFYLFSDSRYVVDGLASWLPGWKRRGWKKADGNPPENLDLWKKLDQLKQQFKKIEFVWVRGHAGHPQNEYCDQLCNQRLDNMKMT